MRKNFHDLKGRCAKRSIVQLTVKYLKEVNSKPIIAYTSVTRTLSVLIKPRRSFLASWSWELPLTARAAWMIRQRSQHRDSWLHRATWAVEEWRVWSGDFQSLIHDQDSLWQNILIMSCYNSINLIIFPERLSLLCRIIITRWPTKHKAPKNGWFWTYSL